MKNIYGYCSRCDAELVPVWFIEDEYKTEHGITCKTGRKRRAVSHLECPKCFKREVVDDSFDEAWHY